MIKELVKLSNHLDAKGYRKEADVVDNLIRRRASKIANMMSTCSGHGKQTGSGKAYVVQYAVIDKTNWSNSLFKKIKDTYSKSVTKNNISHEIIHPVCSNIPSHIKDRHWNLIPPNVEGTQNRPSILSFKIENGNVTYNPELAMAAGWENHNEGFDWNAFKAEGFVTTLQAYINRFPHLKDPEFKFQLMISHGFEPF